MIESARDTSERERQDDGDVQMEGTRMSAKHGSILLQQGKNAISRG